jgi:Mg2+ and Co2+ transporter CorA
MGEIVEGVGADQRRRIADLRRTGRFFWIDVSLRETAQEELGEALGIAPHALLPLVDFARDTPPSRKLHVDGQHVVFAFSCFLESAEGGGGGGIGYQLRPIEVHVLVCGDYMLTLHEQAVSLPKLLTPQSPEGRSEQYVVYVILDAMVATGFDALNEAERTLEGLQLMSTDLRAARVRMATLRAVNTRLSGMRRRIGPQRGIFERISEEIGRVEGLEADSEN